MEVDRGAMGTQSSASVSVDEMKRPHAVIVSPPWPRGGTARIVQSQVEYYRSRGYRTIVICAPLQCWWDAAYPEWTTVHEGMAELGADLVYDAAVDGRRFTLGKYLTWLRRAGQVTALDWIVFTAGSAHVREEVGRTLKQTNVAVCHVNHVFTLQFAKRLVEEIGPVGRTIPMIVETHDVQAHALLERGELNQWTHRQDSESRLVASEIAHLQGAGVLVHLSVTDYEFFKERMPEKRHILVLPTIEESFVARVNEKVSEETIDLLFVGQSTDANCAGLGWFFKEVWPALETEKYQVRIVGQIDALVREVLPEIYARHRECFTGTVRDLTTYYRASRCVFAPMISGTGISIKTIEALSLGKPFVGTSKAYRGMPMALIAQEGINAYDTPEAFAQAIRFALSNGLQVGDAGRRVYEKLFSRDAAFAARDEALNAAVAACAHV